MRLVVDASVAVKWYLPEIHSIRAGRLRDPRFSVVAPDLIRLEFANVLWKTIRRGDLTREGAATFRHAFETSRIQILPAADLVPTAFDLAVDLGRTVYDCLYLALAMEQKCLLITADRKFYAAVASSAIANYILWIEDM